MSKSIYFKDTHPKRSLSWYLVRAISSTSAFLLPKKSLVWAENLLLTPQKPRSFELPESVTSEDLELPIGRIKLYRQGNGPVVLLAHGWSGSASQFFPLMKHLAEMGYTAIAYDQLGHGASEFRHASMPRFVLTFEQLFKHFDQQAPVAGVIAHSMGAAAVINHTSITCPIVLIAPMFKIKENIEFRLDSVGISPVIWQRLLSKIERQFDVEFERLRPVHHIAQLNTTISIIHDKEDRLAPHDDSVDVVNHHEQYTLISTQGLGHNRIIASDMTINTLSHVFGAARRVSRG